MSNADQFPDTRTTLIRRLANDRGDAWRTFLAIYGPLVYRIARRAGLGDSDAEDVLADVMRNLVQAVGRGFEVDHEVGLFRSYLKTLTSHAIVAHRRKQKRNCSSTAAEHVVAADPPPVSEWESAERIERWQLCLERLSESAAVRARDYEAFVRYALDAEPAEAVARDYQITANRLYGIKHAMIRKLQRIWKQLEDELGEV